MVTREGWLNSLTAQGRGHFQETMSLPKQGPALQLRLALVSETTPTHWQETGHPAHRGGPGTRTWVQFAVARGGPAAHIGPRAKRPNWSGPHTSSRTAPSTVWRAAPPPLCVTGEQRCRCHLLQTGLCFLFSKDLGPKRFHWPLESCTQGPASRHQHQCTCPGPMRVLQPGRPAGAFWGAPGLKARFKGMGPLEAPT